MSDLEDTAGRYVLEGAQNHLWICVLTSTCIETEALLMHALVLVPSTLIGFTEAFLVIIIK